MIIHTQKEIRQIKAYLIEKDWGHELRFFNKVIGEIETQGDKYGFLACIGKPDTCALRVVLSNYKKYSIAHSVHITGDLAHANNVDAIDSALGKLDKNNRFSC